MRFIAATDFAFLGELTGSGTKAATGTERSTAVGTIEIRSALGPGNGHTERKVRVRVAIAVARIPGRVIAVARIAGRVMFPCIVVHSGRPSLGHRFRSRLGKSRRNDDDADSDEDKKGFH
jgi:hypothetical protein